MEIYIPDPNPTLRNHAQQSQGFETMGLVVVLNLLSNLTVLQLKFLDPCYFTCCITTTVLVQTIKSNLAARFFAVWHKFVAPILYLTASDACNTS